MNAESVKNFIVLLYMQFNGNYLYNTVCWEKLGRLINHFEYFVLFDAANTLLLTFVKIWEKRKAIKKNSRNNFL